MRVKIVLDPSKYRIRMLFSTGYAVSEEVNVVDRLPHGVQFNKTIVSIQGG